MKLIYSFRFCLILLLSVICTYAFAQRNCEGDCNNGHGKLTIGDFVYDGHFINNKQVDGIVIDNKKNIVYDGKFVDGKLHGLIVNVRENKVYPNNWTNELYYINFINGEVGNIGAYYFKHEDTNNRNFQYGVSEFRGTLTKDGTPDGFGSITSIRRPRSNRVVFDSIYFENGVAKTAKRYFFQCKDNSIVELKNIIFDKPKKERTQTVDLEEFTYLSTNGSLRERYSSDILSKLFDKKSIISDTSKVFPSSSVETNPEFIGGIRGLSNFIERHKTYSDSALFLGIISGRIYIQFIVEKDGSISKPEVLRSVSKSLDKDAMNIVNQFPKFKPAKIKSEPVRCFYTLPITYFNAEELDLKLKCEKCEIEWQDILDLFKIPKKEYDFLYGCSIRANDKNLRKYYTCNTRVKEKVNSIDFVLNSDRITSVSFDTGNNLTYTTHDSLNHASIIKEIQKRYKKNNSILEERIDWYHNGLEYVGVKTYVRKLSANEKIVLLFKDSQNSKELDSRELPYKWDIIITKNKPVPRK